MIDPELAESPFIFPSDSYIEENNIQGFRALDPVQDLRTARTVLAEQDVDLLVEVVHGGAAALAADAPPLAVLHPPSQPEARLTLTAPVLRAADVIHILITGRDKAEALESALAETGVPAVRAVMVGDTSFDMEMAQAAGMTGFGVDWGYHPAERLHATGAVLVAPDYPALTAALLDWAEERAA